MTHLLSLNLNEALKLVPATQLDVDQELLWKRVSGGANKVCGFQPKVKAGEIADMLLMRLEENRKPRELFFCHRQDIRKWTVCLNTDAAPH